MSRPTFSRVQPYYELACAALAGGLWYSGADVGLWPLLLLVSGWLSHLALTRFKSRPQIWDGLIGLFLATAWLGVRVAYDPALALAKFWLLLGAVGIYYAIVHQPDRHYLYRLIACLGVFAVAASLYFLATNAWETYALKMPVLIALGERLTASWPTLSSHRIHPNVMGGLLAGLLPLFIPLIRLATRRWLAVLWTVGALFCALTLALTVSRGAWLGVLIMGGVYALWLATGWWLRRRGFPPDRIWARRWWIMLASGLALAAVAAAGLTLFLARSTTGGAEIGNRLGLLRDSALLAKDYVFTGAGLGLFEMQFSIYTLLIHVGFIPHSHNLLMDVLLGQGVVGLFSFLALLGGSLIFGLRRLRLADREIAALIEAGLFSLGVLLIHGVGDDALYGSRGALLALFVPVGVIIAAGRLSDTPLPTIAPALKRRLWLAAGAAMIVVLALGALAWRPILAAWYANQGAMVESQVELSHYDPQHFDKLTMDQVRRAQNLDEAQGWFIAALALDPMQPTARQRLAEIELARGEYAAALENMQALWDVGWRDSVTRMLLGDAFVANGQVEAAAEVVRGLQWAEARLDGQAWSRYWVNGDFRRAADAYAAEVLVNPANKAAAARQAEAARKSQ